MQFHPKNGRITARLLKEEETTESGLVVARLSEKRPVDFVKVVHVDDTLRKSPTAAIDEVDRGWSGSPYKKDDILLIDPMLCNYVGWLTDEFIIVPEHQVLAVVEFEEGDAVMGEEYEKDNPTGGSRIIAPGKAS